MAGDFKERQEIIKPLFEVKYETEVLINPIVISKNVWGKILLLFRNDNERRGLFALIKIQKRNYPENPDSSTRRL
jgi:hypothetical protein